MELKNKKGFTIIELLIVITMIGILIVLAGSLSSKFAARRNIDYMAHKVSSYLNLVKIQSTRNGVEYRTVFNFNVAGSYMSFITERGDSNRNSSNWIETASETLGMSTDYDIIPAASDIIFRFTPTSSITNNNEQILTIKPSNEDSKIDRCAIIGVSNFGRIRTIMGRWDFDTSTCKNISDNQES